MFFLFNYSLLFSFLLFSCLLFSFVSFFSQCFLHFLHLFSKLVFFTYFLLSFCSNKNIQKDQEILQLQKEVLILRWFLSINYSLIFCPLLPSPLFCSFLFSSFLHFLHILSFLHFFILYSL